MSDKNLITINVLGATNTGKSRISYIIKKTLEQYGIEVEIYDIDMSEAEMLKHCSKDIDKALVKISQESKVNITQFQLNRKKYL